MLFPVATDRRRYGRSALVRKIWHMPPAVSLFQQSRTVPVDLGRSADAERAANDEDFHNRLFEEYGIE